MLDQTCTATISYLKMSQSPNPLVRTVAVLRAMNRHERVFEESCYQQITKKTNNHSQGGENPGPDLHGHDPINFS